MSARVLNEGDSRILFAGEVCGARCVSAGSALIRPKKLKGRSKALQCLRLVERVNFGSTDLGFFFWKKDPF